MMAMDSRERQITSVDKSVKSIVEEFCNETSAHGLGRVLPVKNRTRTILWSILFMGAVVLFSFQLETLIEKYTGRPLTTLITVRSNSSLAFPAITVCNLNIVKNSSFYAQNTSQIHPNIEEGNCQDIDNWELNATTNSGYDSNYLKEENTYACFAELNKTILAKIGHQFKDVVLSCTFRGMSCRKNASLWTNFWHYKFGNCFVFNMGEIRGTKVLQTNKPGMSNGLALEMNIQQQEYLGMSGGAGIKIDISDQGQMPFPLERGVSLAPGYATMIGLKRTVIKRIDPHGDGKRCKSGENVNDSNLYTKILNTSYSLMSCRESCVAKSQLKACGCMDYRFPNDGQTEVCRLQDKNKMKCIQNVQNKFDKGNLECAKYCVSPCRSVDFKKSTSFEAWPSEMFKQMNSPSAMILSEGDVIGKNYLKLNVFYQELEEEVIEEILSYTLESFVSDIGGQLGLWIGFSVLTLAEFVEFIIMLCHFAFSKYTKRSQVNSLAT